MSNSWGFGLYEGAFSRLAEIPQQRKRLKTQNNEQKLDVCEVIRVYYAQELITKAQLRRSGSEEECFFCFAPTSGAGYVSSDCQIEERLKLGFKLSELSGILFCKRSNPTLEDGHYISYKLRERAFREKGGWENFQEKNMILM